MLYNEHTPGRQTQQLAGSRRRRSQLPYPMLLSFGRGRNTSVLVSPQVRPNDTAATTQTDNPVRLPHQRLSAQSEVSRKVRRRLGTERAKFTPTSCLPTCKVFCIVTLQCVSKSRDLTPTPTPLPKKGKKKRKKKRRRRSTAEYRRECCLFPDCIEMDGGAARVRMVFSPNCPTDSFRLCTVCIHSSPTC